MTHSKKSLIAIAGVFISVAIFLMTATQPAIAPEAAPATTQTTAGVAQPTPYENTNITWSSYNASMARNEYLNGTGAAGYINAEPSVFYQNYISVNPSHIIAPKILENDKLGTLQTTWDSSPWATGTSIANVTFSTSQKNISGVPVETLTADVSGTHNARQQGMVYNIPPSNYSSQNLEYDYVTFIMNFAVPRNSGAVGGVTLQNDTYSAIEIGNLITSGTYYFSENLAQIQKNAEYTVTWNTTAGSGYSSLLGIVPYINIPEGAPNGTYSITITALAMTTYPITFGSNYTGSTITSAPTLQLSNFHPDVNNVTIVNNGYSEALSMPIEMGQNYTQTQNQISSGNYIEETTTQGNLEYPTGTDISYTGTNITMSLNGIGGIQIPVLDINGVSYTGKVSNMSGNQTLYAGTVNPNEPNNVIYQVEYTASQWNSITSPPFFLSVQGIEYYWWIGIIAIFGGLGIFAGAKSYATGKEENLRAPPKVR